MRRAYEAIEEPNEETVAASRDVVLAAIEEAIGRERMARRRTRGRRQRLVVLAAAVLVVTVASASAFGTVRDFFFGAHQSVTSGAPMWSPDGRRIAFLSTTCLPGRPPLCESPSKLVVVGLDGRAQRELGQAAAKQPGEPRPVSRLAKDRVRARSRRCLSHAPDGTSWHYSDLVVANVDGSRRRIVAPRGVYEDPVWSPDGRKLAFVRLRGDNAEVYVVAADGTGRRKLAHAVSYVALDGNPKSPNPNPEWSPDGRRIAFTSNRDGNEDIYVVDVDGGGLVNLTRSRGTDRRPVWSPDGRQIAFRGDRDGNGEVYVMNADGSAQRRLTRNPAPDNGAVWSPDGRRILFQRALGDIWVMNRDGSGQRNLTPDVRPARIARDTSPAWSPDGRLIAFLSERDNTGRIYVMTAAGGEPAALGEFVDEFYAVGRISRSSGGVRFSLSVPKTGPAVAERPRRRGIRHVSASQLAHQQEPRQRPGRRGRDLLDGLPRRRGGCSMLEAIELGPRSVDRRSGGGLLESAWNRARRRSRARYGRGSPGEASRAGRSRGSGLPAGILLCLARAHVGFVLGHGGRGPDPRVDRRRGRQAPLLRGRDEGGLQPSPPAAAVEV